MACKYKESILMLSSLQHSVLKNMNLNVRVLSIPQALNMASKTGMLLLPEFKSTFFKSTFLKANFA